MNSPKRRPRKHNVPKRKLPEFCLCCDNPTPWVEIETTYDAEFRDQVHKVKSTVMQCRHCDVTTTSADQDSAILKDIRVAHGISIKKLILQSQKSLKLSIRDLATATHIGQATISRALSLDTLIDASTETALRSIITKLEEEKVTNSYLDLLKYQFESEKTFCMPARQAQSFDLLHA